MKHEEEKHTRKKKNTRACAVCDHRFENSLSKCPSCGHWNIPKITTDGTDQTILLSEVSSKPIQRISTGPWDKCFGGGIVTTSVALIGGVPGAGKSTMSLQLADTIAEITNREIIYVGAEESVEEIKDRAMRLNLTQMGKIRMYPMGSNVDLGVILKNRKPSAIFLDSLPGLVSDPEVAVELCKRFKEYAVELKSPVIVIDHVTKDEDFAGLMALQHAVDTLITLNRDDRGVRYLTTIKNRFGPANISVVLEMTEKGLFLGKDIDDENEDDERNMGDNSDNSTEDIHSDSDNDDDNCNNANNSPINLSPETISAMLGDD